MTAKKRRFPVLVALVLAVGLAAVVFVIATSSSSILSSAQAVNNIDQAKALAEQYLAGRDPDLRIVEIMEFSKNFYIVVQERSTGINAFELLVDRYTGRAGSEPGPNMMWNQKYGHMSRVTNPTTSMPIDAQDATAYAQSWLDANMSGARVEEPMTFYGYYTTDVSRGGRIFGMLSVNGYTGAVWYHSWHGEFIGMKEYE